MEREYYSQRMGFANTTEINLFELRKIFKTTYDMFFNKNFFKEKIGWCMPGSGNYYIGELGTDEDINDYLYLRLRKEHLWPIDQYLENYTEADLFDLIEFCFDIISKPYANAKVAQDEFRAILNPHLKDYANGFSLNDKGCIVTNPDYGLEQIFEAKLISDDDKVVVPLKYAVEKFRNRNSSHEEKREAVRKLADILEHLRPSIRAHMLTKDENDLFNIANNFNIRHNNSGQKDNYDTIWLNWMFYVYLATIHAMIRIIKRHEKTSIKTENAREQP